ncbi:hypothetical protein LNKW23_28880 [Paralimibaculum aggregatum]|uniref:Divergent polysaccharide deacetylase family protein n=1 Tax=Paralimibaculum aggregatum TaxID=3036245 RepID=A0ABQ6LN04_9RHOB|nr:divergent polysaccharide deacetylase family protein [Limibaculum sp. NKW23]GMG83675.1 hypothetical protein LNKW23_28880 [Limibaculum sp. NKW23]
MTRKPRGGSKGLGFFGGLLLGLLLVAAALVALSVTGPAPEPGRIAAVPAPEAAAEADPAETGTGAIDAVPQDGELAVIAPEIAPSDPEVPEPVPQPSGDLAGVRGAIEPAQPAEDGRFSAPEPFETTIGDGQLSGLRPAATLEGPAPVGEAPEVENPEFELQAPALTLNAEPFERRGNLPLVAVVLEDAGSSELEAETLLSLRIPLTVGIAPRGEADLRLAAEAKLQGYEVLAQLPVGGDAILATSMTDLEVSERVEELMASLYMAVGASGLVEEGGALDERIIKGVIPVLERNGFAFVNADASSMEAGRAFAQAFGVAYAGQTLRIPSGATEEEIYDILVGVAASAGEGGGAIISAPPSLAMLRALQKWSVENSGRSVQLAPISAVIAAQNAG